jgi:hypothetical protein
MHNGMPSLPVPISMEAEQATEAKKAPLGVVAIDIEAAGANVAVHPLVSIGAVVGDGTGRPPLERKFWNLEVRWFRLSDDGDITDPGDFEPRCIREHWQKHPEAVAWHKEALATSQEEGINRFVEWFDGLEAKYEKIKIVSDNPAFDIGRLNYAVGLHAGRIDLRMSSDKKTFRGLDDTTRMLSMVPEPVRDQVWEHANGLVPHDHHPTHDAECIYVRWVAIQGIKQIIERVWPQDE